MESKAAVASLSALGHEGRLAIFRLLVQAGQGGVAAGDIARRLAMIPNSLSANLNVHSRAGLIVSRRQGRSILYSADYSAMSRLLGFLVADCCGGATEICGPLSGVVARAAACDGTCLEAMESA